MKLANTLPALLFIVIFFFKNNDEWWLLALVQLLRFLGSPFRCLAATTTFGDSLATISGLPCPLISSLPSLYFPQLKALLGDTELRRPLRSSDSLDGPSPALQRHHPLSLPSLSLPLFPFLFSFPVHPFIFVSVGPVQYSMSRTNLYCWNSLRYLFWKSWQKQY